jgi:hypothetical protein
MKKRKSIGHYTEKPELFYRGKNRRMKGKLQNIWGRQG